MAAKLIVTELVTNAVLHARSEVTVTVGLENDTLRLSVRDCSRRRPSARAYDLEAATGRGLALVDRLSSSWGVDVDDTGKTIWVILAALDWACMVDDEDSMVPSDPSPMAGGSGQGPGGSGHAPSAPGSSVRESA